MRIVLRRAVTACSVAFALAILMSWIAPLHVEAAGVIDACINGGNGGMRLVEASQACHNNETRVQWNVVGPQGPVGPTGPQGAAGPTGPQGPAGADAVAAGPPYIWACSPANYNSGSNTNAAVFIFNGSSTTANVAVHILNKDGANLAGVNIPIAPGGPPPMTYPGQTGTDTVPVASGATLIVNWLMAYGDPNAGGNVAVTVGIVSDQPIAVGANVEFSGFHPMMCAFVHQ